MVEPSQEAETAARTIIQLKTRFSPKLLAEAVTGLSDRQKELVREARFGSLLDFNIKVIPGKMAR